MNGQSWVHLSPASAQPFAEQLCHLACPSHHATLTPPLCRSSAASPTAQPNPSLAPVQYGTGRISPAPSDRLSQNATVSEAWVNTARLFPQMPALTISVAFALDGLGVAPSPGLVARFQPYVSGQGFLIEG